MKRGGDRAHPGSDDLFYRKEKRRFDLPGRVRRLLRNRRAMFVMIVGIPLLLYIVFGSRGVVQRIRLHQQKAELEARIREAEAETKRLQTESKSLDGDQKAIEKVAREKHGMVRQGETVYKVNKKK